MHDVTVQRTVPYGEVDVVVASDIHDRWYVGVATGDIDRAVVFIQVEQRTALELERRAIDLYTVISERGIGLVFEATPDAFSAADSFKIGAVFNRLAQAPAAATDTRER